MRILAGIMILMIMGCQEQGVTPAGILPPDKMRPVLYDMLRSSEFLSGYVLYKDTGINRNEESMKWYHKVWALHQITEEQFRKSYEWYKSNPDIMERLLDSVIAIPAPVADSLKITNTDSLEIKIPTDSLRRRAIENRQPLRLQGKNLLKDTALRDY